jgi:RecA-family ATPase
MEDWYGIKEPEVQWLVDGLIAADGQAAIIGKPKAGKSTFIRSLIVSVVKGRQFLGRCVDIPPNTGRVLYLTLDRKDQVWRVAKELRELGIEQDDAERLRLRSSADLTAKTYSERLEWLKKEVSAAKPHLVVIDLLWQFIIAKNSNDYNATLDGINQLQDALRDCGYKGALVVAIHGRKAVSTVDGFDDVLGSTSQRGSFSTLIMLTHRRVEGVYTVASDQTERDDVLGEIPETILGRGQDGTLQLHQPFGDLVKAAKQAKVEADLQRLIQFVDDHPGSEMEDITNGLAMSKKFALKLLTMTADLRREGAGIKGSPHRYYSAGYEAPEPASEATAINLAEGVSIVYAN